MPSNGGGMSNLFDVVRALERERGSRIWCMVHCNVGHICGPALWSVFRDRGAIGTGQKVELLIHSGGGHPEIAFKVMKFFRRRFREVNVLVPITAKNAATLMCLGADQIFMGELADLGPIDIQIDDSYEHGAKSFSPLDEFKSMEFLRESAIDGMDYYAKLMNIQYGVSIKSGLEASVPLVTALMNPIFAQIDPIKMGGYRRAIAIGEEYAKRMLALTRNPQAPQIVQTMVWEYPSHDFAIEYEEAEELGLPVEKLPAAQDQALTTAILAIGKDHYHGFAPPLPAASPTRNIQPPVRARRGRRASRRQRVNGGEGNRPEERQRPANGRV
jgi:Serine dehydrogenase proteinase